MSGTAPPVSVVTPFYNTAPYLETCIRSVLAQTWMDFEYILVNNCSTDGSAEIARGWAERDARIRVVDQPAFLGQIENYNSALGYISPGSRWVKIVQADDWLYPECLERMVAVGDTDPGVVIVGSYHLYGNLVLFSQVPIERSVHEGRDICRRQLLSPHYLMGNPTTLLYRAWSVRARTPFFEPGRHHEDTEVCFDLLTTGRFGFVPQVLSVVRTDNEGGSITGTWLDYDWFLACRYVMLRRYGATFLSPGERLYTERVVTRQYGRRLLAAALSGRGRAYFAYQRAILAEAGETLTPLTPLAWAWRRASGTAAARWRGLRRRLGVLLGRTERR